MGLKQRLLDACSSNDFSLLHAQIYKHGGLRFKQVRSLAYPLLCLPIQNYRRAQTLPTVEADQLRHQIHVDVERSFNDARFSVTKRQELRLRLELVLNMFYDKHPYLHYYQGTFYSVLFDKAFTRFVPVLFLFKPTILMYYSLLSMLHFLNYEILCS